LTSDDGASFAPPARWSVHAVEAESLRPEELDALARKEHGARRDLVKVGFDDDDTSTPAEILGVLEPSAALFARVPQARELGFGAERFLFTEGGRAGGRCAACQGTGAVELERELLPGELAPCPACDGRRYEPRTLSVKLYGRSIAEVLDLDLLTAARLFGDHPRIARPLRAAAELGVGHLRLGAPPRETSPSERARLRLAVKLDRDPERTAWIVARAADGLFGEDLTRVARALDRLVQSGGAVAAFGARLAEEIPRVLEWPAAKPRRSRLTQSGT
jgi:excinuclease ABC subunit A